MRAGKLCVFVLSAVFFACGSNALNLGMDPSYRQNLPRLNFKFEEVDAKFAPTQDYGESLVMMLAPFFIVSILMVVAGMAFMVCKCGCCVCCPPIFKCGGLKAKDEYPIQRFFVFCALLIITVGLAVCSGLALAGVAMTHSSNAEMMDNFYVTANDTLNLVKTVKVQVSAIKSLNLTSLGVTLPDSFTTIETKLDEAETEGDKYYKIAEENRTNLGLLEGFRIFLQCLLIIVPFFLFSCALCFLVCKIPHPSLINGCVGFFLAALLFSGGGVMIVFSVAQSDVCVEAKVIATDTIAAHESKAVDALVGCLETGRLDEIGNTIDGVKTSTFDTLSSQAESELNCTLSIDADATNYYGNLFDADQTFCSGITTLNDTCHGNSTYSESACTSYNSLETMVNAIETTFNSLDAIKSALKCTYVKSTFDTLNTAICDTLLFAHDLEAHSFLLMGVDVWIGCVFLVFAFKYFSDAGKIAARQRNEMLAFQPLVDEPGYAMEPLDHSGHSHEVYQPPTRNVPKGHNEEFMPLAEEKSHSQFLQDHYSTQGTS